MKILKIKENAYLIALGGSGDRPYDYVMFGENKVKPSWSRTLYTFSDLTTLRFMKTEKGEVTYEREDGLRLTNLEYEAQRRSLDTRGDDGQWPSLDDEFAYRKEQERWTRKQESREVEVPVETEVVDYPTLDHPWMTPVLHVGADDATNFVVYNRPAALKEIIKAEAKTRRIRENGSAIRLKDDEYCVYDHSNIQLWLSSGRTTFNNRMFRATPEEALKRWEDDKAQIARVFDLHQKKDDPIADLVDQPTLGEILKLAQSVASQCARVAPMKKSRPTLSALRSEATKLVETIKKAVS